MFFSVLKKMKSLAKLLFVGIIAATAMFFWQKNRQSRSQFPAPQEFASASPSPAPTLEPAPVPIQVERSQTSSHLIEDASSNSVESTLDSLRSKLRQWRESEARDPDDEEGRERLLQEMLAMVTDENVAETVRSLSAEEMNTPFGTGALHHWMQTDPVTASDWLAARSDTTEEQTMAVAEDWNKNSDGLRQYLDQLPETAWKQTFIQAASSDMTFKDPLEAVKLAEQMKPGDAQTNLLRALACGWVSADPEAALDWVAGVKDPALREQLIASAVQAYALTDPVQAATWLVSEVKSEGIVKDAALNILKTWVATDPAAAANWASRFPEGDIKVAAERIVSRHWLQTDPDAATAWIQNLSGGPATPAN